MDTPFKKRNWWYLKVDGKLRKFTTEKEALKVFYGEEPVIEEEEAQLDLWKESYSLNEDAGE